MGQDRKRKTVTTNLFEALTQKTHIPAPLPDNHKTHSSCTPCIFRNFIFAAGLTLVICLAHIASHAALYRHSKLSVQYAFNGYKNVSTQIFTSSVRITLNPTPHVASARLIPSIPIPSHVSNYLSFNSIFQIFVFNAPM